MTEALKTFPVNISFIMLSLFVTHVCKCVLIKNKPCRKSLSRPIVSGLSPFELSGLWNVFSLSTDQLAKSTPQSGHARRTPQAPSRVKRTHGYIHSRPTPNLKLTSTIHSQVCKATYADSHWNKNTHMHRHTPRNIKAYTPITTILRMHTFWWK